MKNNINTREMNDKLILLGFRESISGTEMLREAIKEWEPGMSITKELYPLIAKKFGSTPTRVERAMRHAIETAFDRGSYDTIKGIFGHSIDPGRGTPTVSEFIARMAVVCSDEA